MVQTQQGHSVRRSSCRSGLHHETDTRAQGIGLKPIVFSDRAKSEIRAIPQSVALNILAAIHRFAATGAACYSEDVPGTLLDQALEKVSSLPQDEQDAIASQILESLAGEQAWKEQVAKNRDVIRRMAAEAIEEDDRGETRPLDELL